MGLPLPGLGLPRFRSPYVAIRGVLGPGGGDPTSARSVEEIPDADQGPGSAPSKTSSQPDNPPHDLPWLGCADIDLR